jgi:SP family general alpha glucoside:H+ symporter-like MFS transporter
VAVLLTLVRINGYCTDKFGYKPTVLGALVAMAAFIFIPVFAQSLTVLVVGEILQGIPWGIFQVRRVPW